MTRPVDTASLPLLQLEEFEGPLDLLLDEVRRQRVAIENIAMAPIVARFLQYVRTAAERNFNLDIEWLHLAATLIHWKSQSLLPQPAGGQPHADPIRDGLVQQLRAHRKDAAAQLAHRRSLEETLFSQDRDNGLGEPRTGEPEQAPFLSVWDLIQQARELACWVEQHREDRHRRRGSFIVAQDDVSVVEMICYLSTQLAAEGGKLEGGRLLQIQPTTAQRSCLFLAMLEMARIQQLQVLQTEMFGKIWLQAGAVFQPGRT